MTPEALNDDRKDEPLKQDIRLLGRILGDTLREQEGEAVFAIVERVRQTAVRFARDGDAAARSELASILDDLPGDKVPVVVRAFSYFLQLANIAEDQHHIRRRRAHDLAGSPPREGSLPYALDRLDEAGVDPARLADFFEHAMISPVLTAHPTEVQRQSMLQNQREIERLLDTRDRQQLTPEEQADNDTALASSVLSLWQTRMLRPVRLKVIDEVKSGINHFTNTFSTELPRLYIQATQLLQARYPQRRWALPPASAAGSAATATAIPSSRPTSCAKPCACNLPPRSTSIWTRSTPWAANCPCPTCWSRSLPNYLPSPPPPPTSRRSGSMNPTARR